VPGLGQQKDSKSKLTIKNIKKILKIVKERKRWLKIVK